MCCKLGVSRHQLCREQRRRVFLHGCRRLHPGGWLTRGHMEGGRQRAVNIDSLFPSFPSRSLAPSPDLQPPGEPSHAPLSRPCSWASLTSTCVCEAQSGNLWVGVLIHPENKQAASFFTGRWLNIFPGSPFYLIHKS